MELKDFKKTIRIYGSHKVRNGFICIKFAHILGNCAVSTERKVYVEDKGGALKSLYAWLVTGEAYGYFA